MTNKHQLGYTFIAIDTDAAYYAATHRRENMINGKRFNVTIRKNNTSNTLEMEISGKQMEDTIKRRALTTFPGAQVTDIQEINEDTQLTLETKKK